jgi:hypothetical protein
MSVVTKILMRSGGSIPVVMIAQLRCLSDQLGRPGICAKRGQSNPVVRKSGTLRLRWKSRVLARRYRRLVRRAFGHEVRVILIRLS